MPLWLISPLISVVLMGLAAGGLWYEKHAYDERRRAEGHTKGVAEVKPSLDAANAQLVVATKQLEADVAAFTTVQGYMQAIVTKSKAMDKALVTAKEAIKKRQVVETTRIQYIENLAPVGATECDKTDDIVTRALR